MSKNPAFWAAIIVSSLFIVAGLYYDEPWGIGIGIGIPVFIFVYGWAADKLANRKVK